MRYLYEINLVTEHPDVIVKDLSKRTGLTVSNPDFKAVINHALTYPWTRDLFDRIIDASTGLQDCILVSKDRNILENYPLASW